MTETLSLLAIGLAAFSGIPGLWSRRGRQVQAGMMGVAALAGLASAVLAVLGPVAAVPVTGNGLREGVTVALALRVDALSAVFLVPLWLVAPAAATSGVGLWPDDHHPCAPATRLWLGLTVAGIAGVFTSAGPLSFLVAWEVMALSAFLAISSEHHVPDVRRAGWVYLVSTRAGTLALFALLLVLSRWMDWGVFAAVPAGVARTGPGLALFLLALFAFGLKAGMFPLHFWLPPAHAAAPSHVSALLSGVLIKTGIYGLARVLSLVPDPPMAWGVTLLVLGAVSGILGVGYALGSHDLKRLLAYHSIENIGIILIGLGLGLVGRSLGDGVLTTLGLAGALLHVVNHALFKSLLFLAGGTAVHSAGTRQLDQLGGLARVMPSTMALFLLGAAAISGLPPLNGFVSEWLIYNGLFAAMPRWPLALLGITSLALIGGLCLACFAKATGAVFLGEPRTPHAARAAPPARITVLGMLIPAVACVVIGLVPGLTMAPLDAAVRAAAPGMTPVVLSAAADAQAIAWGTAPLLALLGALWWWLTGRQADPPKTVTWDCGYAAPTARMQYTASSFASIILGGLRHVLFPQSHAPDLAEAPGMLAQARRFPPRASFHSHVPDGILDRLLTPVGQGVVWLFGHLRVAHAGSIHLYLLYIVVTLVVLLAWSVS